MTIKQGLSKVKWYLGFLVLGGVLVYDLMRKKKTPGLTAGQLATINKMKPPPIPTTLDGEIAELKKRGLVK